MNALRHSDYYMVTVRSMDQTVRYAVFLITLVSQGTKMSKIGLGLLVLFLTSQAQAVPQPDDWKTYVDEQFGTRVEYPSWFSVREGGPALGPGERLVTADNRAEIEIYSLPNQVRRTPRSYLAEKMRLNPSMLHYERVTPRFFVLSAAANDRIYYTRCNFSQRTGGTIHCVYLGYPRSEKRDWDQIVTRVSLSLRP